jgi:hypothetical protein
VTPHEDEDVAAIYPTHPEQPGPSQSFASSPAHFQLVSEHQHALIYGDSSTYATSSVLSGSIPDPSAAVRETSNMTNIQASSVPQTDVQSRSIIVPGLWGEPMGVMEGDPHPAGSREESSSQPIHDHNTLNTADFIPLSPVESDGSYMDSPQAETSLAGQTREADEPFPSELVSIGGGNWKCQICNQQFRRKRRALTHFLNNHGKTKLTCGGMCGKPHW